MSASVVRPPRDEPVIVARLLDAGLHNVLFLFVESAEDARIAATRAPSRRGRVVAETQLVRALRLYGEIGCTAQRPNTLSRAGVLHPLSVKTYAEIADSPIVLLHGGVMCGRT